MPVPLGVAIIGGILKIEADLFRSVMGANDNYAYADRVRERALEDPVSHNLPYSFDADILATTPIQKPNGYTMYQMPGSIGTTNGVFEIGVNKDGVIDHRFFRRY